MNKNQKQKNLTIENLENRAAPFTTPVLRDPIIIEPTEPPESTLPLESGLKGPADRGPSGNVGNEEGHLSQQRGPSGDNFNRLNHRGN